MSKADVEESVVFDPIDFDQIEYRNEYRFGRNLTMLWLMILTVVFLLYRGFFEGLSPLSNADVIIFFLIIIWCVFTQFVFLKSRFVITGTGITLKRPIYKDIELPY